MLGSNWAASRRFGVRQGAKIRLIDDFSQSLVNLAVTCPEKITGEGVDKVAALAKLWARLLQSKRVEVSLSTGEVLRGQRHEVFESSRATTAKCFDLEAAYKQCPLADDEAQLSVVAIEDPVQPRAPVLPDLCVAVWSGRKRAAVQPSRRGNQACCSEVTRNPVCLVLRRLSSDGTDRSLSCLWHGS